jgi:hypothetical protein
VTSGSDAADPRARARRIVAEVLGEADPSPVPPVEGPDQGTPAGPGDAAPGPAAAHDDRAGEVSDASSDAPSGAGAPASVPAVGEERRSEAGEAAHRIVLAALAARDAADRDASDRDAADRDASDRDTADEDASDPETADQDTGAEETSDDDTGAEDTSDDDTGAEDVAGPPPLPAALRAPESPAAAPAPGEVTAAEAVAEPPVSSGPAEHPEPIPEPIAEPAPAPARAAPAPPAVAPETRMRELFAATAEPEDEATDPDAEPELVDASDASWSLDGDLTPPGTTPSRSGRWLLATILGAIALALLFPLAVAAIRQVLALS